ncbi:hypothetical protein V8G54_032318 [Vigna mungo]|uniref:Uncharacterized protein n=1 Tax=Vigna mungo TaxID=3915 RepID=A0AAQ3MLS4_VIGMU
MRRLISLFLFSFFSFFSCSLPLSILCLIKLSWQNIFFLFSASDTPLNLEITFLASDSDGQTSGLLGRSGLYTTAHASIPQRTVISLIFFIKPFFLFLKVAFLFAGSVM